MIGDCWCFLQYSGGSYRNTCTLYMYVHMQSQNIHSYNKYTVCTSIYYTCTVIQSAFNSEVQMSIGKCIGPINGGKRQRYQVYIHDILNDQNTIIFLHNFFFIDFSYIYTHVSIVEFSQEFSHFSLLIKKKANQSSDLERSRLFN